VWIFSQEDTRKKLAQMVIKHEYPFQIVKHEGFIEFMQTAQPNFVIPGKLSLKNNCLTLFKSLKSAKMAKISRVDHLSLTTELWTSSDLTGYIVITGHYIDENWKLNKTILSFCPLLSPHTGQVIADRLPWSDLDPMEIPQQSGFCHS
jgi:hypothetical protein